jgi:hypothetical protein
MSVEGNHEVVSGQSAGLDISLWRAGVVALFAAVLSNVLAQYLLSFVLDYPQDFIPLRPSSIAIFTAVGALAATLVLALLRRRSARPEAVFKRIAWTVLALSIVPNLVGYARPDLFPITGSDAGGFLMLLPFHFIAGILIIGLLTRLHEA